jgi:hypothetical protein
MRLAVLLLLLPAPALAAGDALEQARKAFAALEYERVPPLLEKALKHTKDPHEEARIYELWAHVHVAYEEEDEARDAFIEVLRREPNFTPAPGTSPKIVAAFRAAQAKLRGGETPPEEAPVVAAPLAAPDEPLYMRWWVWAAAGAVVVGGGVALGWVLLRDEPPPHDYGPIVLQ